MKPLRITLIQTDLRWEDPETNRVALEQLIRGLEEPGHLVVLPEMFTTGFSMEAERLAETMDGPTMRWMRQLAAEARIILTGSVIVQENGQYFNRMVWMMPDGRLGTYDKRHLFAYAGEDQVYQPGKHRMIATVNGWKIQLQICYDLRFPVWSRQQMDDSSEQPAPEYDMLLYVANWPQRRSHAWKSLLTARAIENQCFVAGVNRIGTDGKGIAYGGDSRIIDPLGEILYEAGDRAEVQTFTLDPARLLEVRKTFPFLRDADRFHIHPDQG